MKTQNFVSPYIISPINFIVQDKSTVKLEPKEKETLKYNLLEKYTTDIYKLLITKLAAFDSQPIVTKQETAKLKSLLDELIHVKSLLANRSN